MISCSTLQSSIAFQRCFSTGVSLFPFNTSRFVCLICAASWSMKPDIKGYNSPPPSTGRGGRNIVSPFVPAVPEEPITMFTPSLSPSIEATSGNALKLGKVIGQTSSENFCKVSKMYGYALKRDNSKTGSILKPASKHSSLLLPLQYRSVFSPDAGRFFITITPCCQDKERMKGRYFHEEDPTRELPAGIPATAHPVCLLLPGQPVWPASAE